MGTQPCILNQSTPSTSPLHQLHLQLLLQLLLQLVLQLLPQLLLHPLDQEAIPTVTVMETINQISCHYSLPELSNSQQFLQKDWSCSSQSSGLSPLSPSCPRLSSLTQPFSSWQLGLAFIFLPW